MTMKMVVAALCLFAVSGCTRIYPYVTMSSHTIAVGDKQEADVLWVADVRDDSMSRCHNSPQGPKCVRVQH